VNLTTIFRYFSYEARNATSDHLWWWISEYLGAGVHSLFGTTTITSREAPVSSTAAGSRLEAATSLIHVQ